MVKVKKILLWLVPIISIIAIVLNFDKIKNIFDKAINNNVREVEIKPSNKYTTNNSFAFVKISKNYEPTNKQDLLNIFYNVINNGWEEFRFYCPTEYETCIDDIESLSNDKETMSIINNMVHPYNSYKSLEVKYDTSGEINIYIKKIYTEEEIEKIDKEIDTIIKKNITNDMDLYTKIKTIHNYIINNTKYDTLYNANPKKNKSPYDAERMTGLLFDHYSICSGYAQTMSVVLNKLGVKNYRIVSQNHVWNAVYYKKNWYHLDLTWDDPVTTSGNDILKDNYFLITDEELFNQEEAIKDHQYDKNIYTEFKQK